jgi:hypothetical protein
MSINHSNDVITIRSATSADQDALVKLAQRDSAAVPSGPVLVAEAGGTIRAAIGVEDGRVIADPFQPTIELVDLLRTRVAGRRRRGALRIVARYEPRVAA